MIEVMYASQMEHMCAGAALGVCTCIQVNTQDFWQNKFLYM
jgi:hypothetical protein